MIRSHLSFALAGLALTLGACGGSQPCPAQTVCPACPTMGSGEAVPVATIEEWWHLPGSIHFATGGTEVDARSRLFLEEAVRMMRDRNDVLRVRVEGHTDERGNDGDNLRLSEQRARSVADLLTGMGVPRDRIEVVGYGSQQRLATGNTPEDNAINRRIEFSLLMLRPAVGG
ncbi:MAG: OmpA family protein [Sandaracinaceae bacterium]|nr:OmpA family protein [Sandaracinaceae bacterium]